MELISAPYYAEPHDDKTSGTLVVRKNTVVAVYTLPKYRTRTMLLTEQGLKFCLKGRPEEFMTPSTSDEELLCEVRGNPT
jgi:hypothetical protein